jgi:hypothetical protein
MPEWNILYFGYALFLVSIVTYRFPVGTLGMVLGVIGLQFCALCPWALLPLRSPLWGQFVCHKLLRLATPYLVLLSAGSALACLRTPASFWIWLGLGVLVALTLLLLAPREGILRRGRNQFVLLGYLFAAPVVATLHALRGNWDVWSRGRAPRAS